MRKEYSSRNMKQNKDYNIIIMFRVIELSIMFLSNEGAL